MEHTKITPKDFFLWAGAMISLYASVVAFLALVFSYINHVLPDTALSAYYADPYSSIAYEMASLIVFAPLLLILMRTIRHDIARNPSRNEIWIRRWALFLTLFIAGLTIAIDLIVLLTTFLSGEELSARFLLKVLVVLLVAGAGFLHFIADIRGYWTRNTQYARYINWAVGVLVVITILAGFFIVGTPAEARHKRLDTQRVSDLQNIQWQVVNYYQQKQALPGSIVDLEDPIAGYNNPLDPKTREQYTYRATGPLTFELCATFDTQGDADWGRGEAMPLGSYGTIEANWAHDVGETCYTRTIDPERYPPYTKGPQF